MVNRLHLYSTFLTIGHSKCFTILPNIHPFIHTCTHQQQCQLCKATARSSGAIKVRCLAQGHLDTRQGGAGDPTFWLPANPALPPEPHAATCGTTLKVSAKQIHVGENHLDTKHCQSDDVVACVRVNVISSTWSTLKQTQPRFLHMQKFPIVSLWGLQASCFTRFTHTHTHTTSVARHHHSAVSRVNYNCRYKYSIGSHFGSLQRLLQSSDCSVTLLCK